MEENNIIICSNCYEENNNGSLFCKNCGAKLYHNSDEKEEINMFSSKCSNCGKEIEEEWKFCNYCGAEISEDKSENNNMKSKHKKNDLDVIVIGFSLICLFLSVFTILFLPTEVKKEKSISSNSNNYCIETGCTRKRETGSIYCHIHKPTYSYSSSTSFNNKYGTSTTKCNHKGCNNYIASSGDTNCCTIHSNKCGNCKKYIDEDAFYCMDCMTKALSR